jgi:hypothetical protein
MLVSIGINNFLAKFESETLDGRSHLIDVDVDEGIVLQEVLGRSNRPLFVHYKLRVELGTDRVENFVQPLFCFYVCIHCQGNMFT